MQAPLDSATPIPARIRLVALPTEHGGWGFLLEPIVLGLALAPTGAGLLLGIAALGAFLTRHPLQLALGDRQRGKRYPRTILAERFALGYGLLTLLGLGGAAWLAEAPFWQALALAAPLAALQQAYDLRKQSRALAAELAGAAALAALTPAILLAAGWELTAAFVLWFILIARAIPAILYVRARLRRVRGIAASATSSFLAHGMALAVVAGMAAAGLTPWTAPLALAILALRAIYGLSSRRRPIRAAIVGFQELAFGILTVALVTVGYLI